MIPTFVFGWPTGKEQGDYLAVDLGGTNLRVCLVTLLTDGKFEITQSKYRLTEEQKQEDGEKLFDFCAECLKTFVESHIVENVPLDDPLPMGFTFSYPCDQERIDHGTLIRWTKGFGAPNVEGRDVGEMFRKALEKAKVPVKMTALINDTTGTLIASSYVQPRTKIAVILGTGCNAAYMEKVGLLGSFRATRELRFVCRSGTSQRLRTSPCLTMPRWLSIANGSVCPIDLPGLVSLLIMMTMTFRARLIRSSTSICHAQSTTLLWTKRATSLVNKLSRYG